MRPNARRAGLLLSLALAACQGSAPAAQEAREAKQGSDRAMMGPIADALGRAFPLSLGASRLEDPAAREQFRVALQALADSTGHLEQHGRSREASFAYLSRSLEHDARVARQRLAAGQDAEAQFVVRQLVGDCVACHSRLPDLDDSKLGARLLASIDPQTLPLTERVRVEAATRQFDAALDGYEQLFRDPEIPPAQLDLDGRLLEYLTISIRVKQDLRRPRWTLERLAQRPDVPEYLAEDLSAWLAALEELAARPRMGDAREEARMLVQDGRLEQTPLYDRRGTIHALLASSLLHQYLSRTTPGKDELAQIYYLLGLTETRASRSLWLSEADVYLDTSVRSSPGSPYATRAYKLLERETLAGYTGSAGLQLPEDVRQHLDELHALIEAASPAPASGR